MLAFSDCLLRGNLNFVYCDLLRKSWFLYYSLIQKNVYTFSSVYTISKCVTVFWIRRYKHMLILETLWYVKKIDSKRKSFLIVPSMYYILTRLDLLYNILTQRHHKTTRTIRPATKFCYITYRIVASRSTSRLVTCLG